MSKITQIRAREILDSRGNPTVEAMVKVEGGLVAIASVPSGASIGKYEALELRDGDKRYGGMGVFKAVKNVNEVIGPRLVGLEVNNQLEIDREMILLDGTKNKHNLGANAILSVSIAVCKTASLCEKVPTYEHVGHLFGIKKEEMKIPGLILNLINGGKHGSGNLDFQEFHVIPSLDVPYHAALQMGEEIYQSIKYVLIRHGAIHSVGDEGGFAPNLFTNLDALEVLLEGIKETPYEFKKHVFLGLDVAADNFFENSRYKIRDRTLPLDSNELIEFYRDLVNQYPLLTLEDPLQEDDWDGWTKFTNSFENLTVVGDDLLATNKARVEEAIKRKACNGILVKPNQIGTISETIEIIKLARNAGWKVIVSHRSGETNDDFIADFAVGAKADYTKFGAPARGERVAKYNRLTAIEREITR